jgi:hypothetical protein
MDESLGSAFGLIATFLVLVLLARVNGFRVLGYLVGTGALVLALATGAPQEALVSRGVSS